jgi:ketosteroid isomerase-like protein
LHPNADLLHRLFTALDHHDHRTMASCYHPEATFRDIAFDLRGRPQIHSMWHMICKGDIRATFKVAHASDQEGRVRLVDTYTFGASKAPPKRGRPVRNVVDSRFQFQDGLIIEQLDFCDARAWAKAALGGPIGFLAGRIRFLRSRAAGKKLEGFVANRLGY